MGNSAADVILADNDWDLVPKEDSSSTAIANHTGSFPTTLNRVPNNEANQSL